MRPLAPADHLIACVGNRVDPRCSAAMECIALWLPDLSIRFVDINWLASVELASVVFCWVVDVDLPVDQMQGALQVGALLIPAERPDLKALCRPERCHVYETSSEAAERIAWTLRAFSSESNGRRQAGTRIPASSTLQPAANHRVVPGAAN
jgi:hypothetical protein